jgi:hypothetical protein
VRRWGSIEYDDPAATSSAKHQREPFIYLIEPIDPADQVIGIDFLVEIQIGEHRKIDSRPHRAVRSAAHHLSPHHLRRVYRRLVAKAGIPTSTAHSRRTQCLHRGCPSSVARVRPHPSAAARLPIVGHVGFYLTVFLICSTLPTINTGIGLQPLRHCVNYFVRSTLRINDYVHFGSL